jgi:REP element-mobilizing transposase RayT
MTLSYHTEFLTATILDWKHLLKDDNCKQIIIDSLRWLVEQKRCHVNAFVIMPNHIHLLWKISDGVERFNAQGALLSFTAHAFKKYLMTVNPVMLNKHYVNKIDRQYQFWQRESMVKECWSQHFFNQKMEYIHNNPCQSHWNLTTLPENYKWSSAAFYQNQDKSYNWLTHFIDS